MPTRPKLHKEAVAFATGLFVQLFGNLEPYF
jgi:hypothetical protein